MATLTKISQAFPKALPNAELVQKVSERLGKFGFQASNTIVASSLCSDELSRPLERAFTQTYGANHFSMGGLSGFPWGGLTSFGAMASHIPNNGHCLLVYGPHVGVNSQGRVGTVERTGCVEGGPCCGSAHAACAHVLGVHDGTITPEPAYVVGNPQDAIDAQQHMVNTMLFPQVERLANAKDNVSVELPYVLLDTQREMIERIVTKGASNVADGMIAVLGGITINTPPDMSDYYMTAHFDLYNNKGDKIEEMCLE